VPRYYWRVVVFAPVSLYILDFMAHLCVRHKMLKLPVRVLCDVVLFAVDQQQLGYNLRYLPSWMTMMLI
jgi:hypothetical protein